MSTKSQEKKNFWSFAWLFALGIWWVINSSNLAYAGRGMYFAIDKNLPNKAGKFGLVPTIEKLAEQELFIIQTLDQVLSEKNLKKLRLLNSELQLIKAMPGYFINKTGYFSEIVKAPGFKWSFLIYRPNSSKPCDKSGLVLVWGGSEYLYNFTNQEAVNWLANYVVTTYKKMAKSKYFDGVFFDGIRNDIFDWMQSWVGAVDCDCDGLADSKEDLDAAWAQGVQSFLSKVKAGLPVGSKIVANDATPYLKEFQGLVDGVVLENQLIDFKQGYAKESLFQDLIMQGYNWSLRGPYSLMMNGGPDSITKRLGLDPWNYPLQWGRDLVPLVKNDTKTMRFGLGCSLVAGVHYSYDFGRVAWGWAYDWVYPEFAKARYLGEALGKPELYFLGNQTNLLRDGDFNSGNLSANWELHIDSSIGLNWEKSNIISENGMNYVALKTNQVSQAKDWQAKLVQRNFANIEKDQDYILIVKMKAIQPKKVGVEIYHDGTFAGWQAIFEKIWIRATPEWQTFSYMLKAKQNVVVSGSLFEMFAFDLGGDGIEVDIDSVQLIKSQALFTRAYQGGVVYVNPTTASQTINLGRSYYNLSGKLVNSATIPATDAAMFFNIKPRSQE